MKKCLIILSVFVSLIGVCAGCSVNAGNSNNLVEPKELIKRQFDSSDLKLGEIAYSGLMDNIPKFQENNLLASPEYTDDKYISALGITWSEKQGYLQSVRARSYPNQGYVQNVKSSGHGTQGYVEKFGGHGVQGYIENVN